MVPTVYAPRFQSRRIRHFQVQPVSVLTCLGRQSTRVTIPHPTPVGAVHVGARNHGKEKEGVGVFPWSLVTLFYLWGVF